MYFLNNNSEKGRGLDPHCWSSILKNDVKPKSGSIINYNIDFY
jgi:hypothetical protein